MKCLEFGEAERSRTKFKIGALREANLSLHQCIQSVEQLLADFPYLEEQDIRDALGFAARLAQGHEIRLAG